MRNSRFANFGDLYRAALAESNPEIKQTLLADVKKELDRWAASDLSRPIASPLGSKPSQRTNTASIHRVA
jgi:hypothetical protein